jgi:hypothetical protein
MSNEAEKRGKLIQQLGAALLLTEELNDPDHRLSDRAGAGRSKGAAVSTAECWLGSRVFSVWLSPLR